MVITLPDKCLLVIFRVKIRYIPQVDIKSMSNINYVVRTVLIQFIAASVNGQP